MTADSGDLPSDVGTATMLPLDQVWRDCVELLRWISPPLAELHNEQPPFLAILAQRP